MKKNVSIVIPVYNEEDTLREVMDKVLSLPFVMEVVTVDDASVDSSPDILKSYTDPRLKYIRLPHNQGKTAALKRAFSEVEGDIVVIQDADLEYNPDEILHLCNPIWNNNADIVFGSRFLVRNESRVLYFYHYLGNRFITLFSNMFTNKNMTDIETCYKAFRRFIIAEMPISSRGFGFEVEVTANICRTQARIFETPISYYGRTYEEGKKISYRDGVKAIWYILRYNLFSGSTVRNYVNLIDQQLADLRKKQKPTQPTDQTETRWEK